MVTPKMQIAFPTIGQIRKGAAKAKNDRGIEVVGKDLQSKFRVVFFPGNDGADQVFLREYKSLTPERLYAMVPFRTIGQSWTVFNEAYNAGRMIAQANDEHYITLRNPQTGEYIVKDGQPFRKFEPGQTISYETGNGKKVTLKLKTYGRLRLFLPIFERMVTLELRTTSFYDRINITEQLGAITAAAEALNGGNCAGIPFWIYRRPASIVWNKPDGSASRVDKWLINIEIDSSWVKAAIARLRKLAMGEEPAGLLAPLTESHPEMGAQPTVIEASPEMPDPEQDAEDAEDAEDVIEGSFQVGNPGEQGALFPEGAGKQEDEAESDTINVTRFYEVALGKKFHLPREYAVEVARYAGVDMSSSKSDFGPAYMLLPYFAEARACGLDFDSAADILKECQDDLGKATEILRKKYSGPGKLASV